MKDIQARLEKCLAEMADCETISRRATDKEKRDLFARLHQRCVAAGVVFPIL
jgi:hypothetical protein